MNRCTINQKIFLFLFSFFVMNNDLHCFSFGKSKEKPEQKIKEQKKEESICKVNGLAGKCPKEICKIIANLKKKNDREVSSIDVDNRLLLYGPPGNGKSTIAKKISELSNSKYEFIMSSTIINRYSGVGPNKILFSVDEALKTAERTGKIVVLFFDEIDNIAKKNKDDESISEHENTISTLWQILDKYKDNPRVFFIVATNKFNKLEKRFVNRFGENIIEIPNPDNKQREEVLRYYVNKHGLNELINENLFKKILDQTNGLCSRSLEDFIRALGRKKDEIASDNNVIWETLEKIKKTSAEENSEIDYDKWLDRGQKGTTAVYHGLSIIQKLIEILGKK